MGTGYAKTDPTNFVDGETIEASDFTTEFNAIDASFHLSTGHTHDGTTAEGGPVTKLLGTAITIGNGASGTDIAVTFDGETNDGVLTWMEDEDYFKFSDDALVNSDEKLYFRDTAIYLNSSADGQLDIVADTEIQIAATTIDINGNVDISGTVTIGSAEISEAELEILDGATATTAELNYNDTGAAVGTVVASKTVTADANKDVASFRNITLTGELDGGSLDISGDADIDGTTNLDAVDIDGTVQIDGATTFGVDDTGVDVKFFGATSGAYLLWDESEDKLLTAGGTTVDIVKDKLLIGGTAVTTTAAELNVLDAVTAGTVTASLGVVVDSNKDIGTFRNVTLSGELDAGSLDVSGDADIDGTTNLDAVDIDGNVQLDGTLTVGVDDTGYDVKLFGATASAYMLWDASADDLILGGDAGLVVPDGQFSLGSTAVTTTAAEINLIDGGTSRGTTAVASGDGILINDAGTMRMTNVDTVSTYFSSHNVGGSNIVTTGALDTGSITSGFGAIDNGASNITTTGDISGGTVNATSDTAAGDNAAIGYTSAEGLILTGQGSTNDITLKRDDDTAVLEVATGQSDIEVTGGNIFFGTASKGVYLGVTSATAANLLDDYEEGTWTAALEGSTSDPSSAVTVSANYTKIGNLVYVTAAFNDANTTGAAGGIRVSGLPFTPSPANQMTGNVTFHTMATIASGTVNLCPFFQASDVAFYQSKTAAAWSETQHNAGSGRYLYFSGIYKT
tara:strand:- start:79 stop:2292 length:2214 start_codon:yes stop_codon:yes gene_type:complete